MPCVVGLNVMTARRPSLFSHMKDMPETVIDFFAKKLNVIRADDDKFRGNCVHCSGQTVLALKKGTAYKPKTVKDEVLIKDNDDKTMIKIPTDNDDAKIFEEILNETGQIVGQKKNFETTSSEEAVEFLKYLKSQEAGSILYYASGDHSCVFIKSPSHKIYLLDSDAHYYCEITDLKDFNVPSNKSQPEEGYEDFRKYRKAKNKDPDNVNYFFDAEEGISLYQMGLIDSSWVEKLKLLEGNEMASDIKLNDKKDKNLEETQRRPP